jgi:hypothetical protein
MDCVIFISSDGKQFKVPLLIKNMIGIQIPDFPQININISSFSLEKFLKYCEGHNYIPYDKEIKRPLNDDLRICIENDFDYEFISQLNIEETIIFLNETLQLKNDSLQDLCLTRIALIIRNSKLEDLIHLFKIEPNEFSEDLINKIINDNSSLMTMDDDRVKELLNDDL